MLSLGKQDASCRSHVIARLSATRSYQLYLNILTTPLKLTSIWSLFAAVSLHLHCCGSHRPPHSIALCLDRPRQRRLAFYGRACQRKETHQLHSHRSSARCLNIETLPATDFATKGSHFDVSTGQDFRMPVSTRLQFRKRLSMDVTSR
jgi:hypothetical protein